MQQDIDIFTTRTLLEKLTMDRFGTVFILENVQFGLYYSVVYLI
jgi:hypothetical protein